MSQKLPKEVMKQILYLQSHLYSESYMIRMAVIEAMGYLIYDTLDTSDSNTTMSSLSSYYEILKERHKDISSNVRVKVMQVVLKLSERRKNRASSSYIPLSLRSEFISLAISRLEDKSTNVRRNAIKLLVKFIETSPFILSQDSGSLSLELLNRRREALLHIIKDKCHMRENDMEVDGIADNYAQESTKEDIGSDLEDDNMDTNIQPEISAFQDLKVLLAYYSDAIAFVEMIKKAATIILQLMMSNSKSEAIEAMRFFMVCNAYEMDFAKEGIRTMIHKIWDKDTGETGRMSVKDTLVKYYTTLYIYNNSDRIDHNIAAMNLISLAVDMSLSELTSLEQLLCVISSLHINSKIVDSLWNIFSSSSEKYKNKLGAIIIIGMIAKSIPSVVTNNIKIIIEFLSSSDAVNNLLITRYVCVALVQLKYSPKKDYSKIRHPTICEPLISSIKNIILGESSSRYWFCFAEQAISATYLVCASPNKILSEIICALSKKCFSEEMINRLESDSLKYSEGNSSPKCQVPLEGSKIDLCKLFFVVGHIAIKQLVYLEELEQEWKQLRHAEISKAESVSLKSPSKIINKSLDAIMDTEDEINEFMRTVKEERLLYGKKSLLGVYGEIIAFVCSNNSSNDRDLQNMAIISLCKLMCVCSKFCENNLDMLLSILETSDCPVIRNNIIIGLGDMTMCFNSLLDKKISHLYDRLNDKDPSVRKNVLMLLSFLILNGIVRIKGQISLMAKCLDDKDPRISNIAKIFFSEFASRDNSVYNNFADIISNLLDENSGITETAFQNIFKTILEFMKKDRATENIIEKICQRFGNSYSESHWRSYSFCLASLAYQSERCMRKFMDCLPYYSNKLGSECIMSRFTETCIKAKKIATQEFKQVIENFEGVLKEAHEKCVQNQGSIERSMEELEKLRECGKVGPNEHTAN